MAVVPPAAFGIVDAGIFRAAHPHEGSLAFVGQLGLRCVLNVAEEPLPRACAAFCAAEGIDVVHLGADAWAGLPPKAPPSEQLCKLAIELALSAARQPVLITCHGGLHATGAVVGCLRRLAGWSVTSALDEMRNHCAGTRTRFANEQCVELFDVDLVSLPSDMSARLREAMAVAGECERGPLVSPGTRFSEKSLCADEDD